MSLLPENLQDLSSLTIEKIMKEYLAEDIKPVLILTMNNAPDSFLPFLAEMFHCLGYEGYLGAQTRNEKISIIKKSVYAHKTKGTVFAIKNILKSMNVNARLINWYEYEGRPHSYKLEIGFTNKPVDKEKIHLLLKQIKEYKQLRANPETVIIVDNKLNISYSSFAFILGQKILINWSKSDEN